MTTSQTSSVMQHLRRAVLVHDGAGLTDGQLLECFITHGDDRAFEILVRRHGPMVLNVCGRVLHHQADAEDAFQATFLILARKAPSVRPRDMVANWLYGVAYHTAVKARALRAKRWAKEKPLNATPEPEAVPPAVGGDWQPILDQELSRLPDKYRIPILLCDVEGKTRKEAARQLGWPEGTVSGRLARARALLAKRLTRRGLVLAGGTLALATREASAALSPTLVRITVQAAASAPALGAVPAKVAALIESVLQSMLLTKLKMTTVLLLPLLLVGAGVGIGMSMRPVPARGQSRQGGPAQPAPNPTAKAKPGRHATPAEQLEALLREYRQELKQHTRETKDPTTGFTTVEVTVLDSKKYAPRFFALAATYPGDPAAVDALVLVAQEWPAQKEGRRAIDLLLEKYPDSPKLVTVAEGLASVTGTWGIEGLEEIIRKATGDRTRATALLKLARYYDETHVHILGETKEHAAARRKKAIALYRVVAAGYAQLDDGRYAKLANDAIVRLEVLVVGRAAPEILGVDLAGKPMRLSDFRGRIVLLVFWGHWCPPCMAQVPQEKALVKRLASKPFTLVGVNSDPDREEARKRSLKEGISWRSFWNGPEGRGGAITTTAWRVVSWPTLYVIDHRGVIRARPRDIDKNLDDVLEKLFKEVERERDRH